MNDEEYFIYRHKKIFGYTPNFRNPQTFNEKIIHRILFDRNPIYTALADKLKARIYIAERLKDFHVKNTLDSKHVDVRSHVVTSFHSNATDHNDDSCNSMSGGIDCCILYEINRHYTTKSFAILQYSHPSSITPIIHHT